MGLFSFFRKKQIEVLNNSSQIDKSYSQGHLSLMKGPIYLEGIVDQVYSNNKEWRGKLKSKDGNTRFRIKYYGIIDHKSSLITNTDFAPCLIFAENILSKEQVLLFDGCNHGYNAMFVDNYNEDQISNRPVVNYFADKLGNMDFDVVVSTYNNFDYDAEFAEYVDKNGNIEILDGSIASFEQVKRNGYDRIVIELINSQEVKVECLSEELA